MDLARLAYEALREIPGIEVPWEPDLSIVAFRPRYGGEVAGRRLLERLNASQRVFLSSTTAGGHLVLRFAVLSVRTHRARVEEATEVVRQALTSLASEDETGV